MTEHIAYEQLIENISKNTVQKSISPYYKTPDFVCTTMIVLKLCQVYLTTM